MSDPLVIDPRPSATPLDPSEALEALPAAAALLDERLALRQANASFLALCPGARPGARLGELLVPAEALPSTPGEGEVASYLGHGLSGAVVQVSLRRSGRQVGVLVTPVPRVEADGPLASALRSVDEARRIQSALLALSREVALAAAEDELVASIARCVRELFPRRNFCVRIVDPHSYALTTLYAEGRLLEGARERLAMRRSAAEKAQIDLRGLPPGRVELTEKEPLVFAGSAGGFATPLSAAGQFFGLVNLEYPKGLEADRSRDERLLIQLVNQAAIGVRNAKLIEELTFVKKYWEQLFENANALIFAANRRHEVIVFNRAMEGLTGYARAEVIGRSVAELTPEASSGAIEALLERTLAGSPVTNAEAVLRSKSGAEVRVAISTATVTNAAGELEGVIAIGQDLSRQRELERRIVQAEKLASLGQLAAGVVHEINNPLTTITMYSEALLQLAPAHGAPPGDLDKLHRIHESADRILRFARDLTSYAKPAREKPETVDLNSVLDQAARYCEHAFKQSGAMFARYYGETLPAILGVKANLVQVFVNLLTNACHAMPNPGGQVSVSTREKDGGVEIEVSDSGAGIAAANLSRIFDPFFTTKLEGQGTGLGLFIVQGIVEKHGGTVRVSSEPGRGTSFTLWLPVGPA